MTHLLFPGRHHLLTQFQLSYLKRVTEGDRERLLDVHGKPLRIDRPFESILWAVTSANHNNTRRNPLPAHRRVVAIEELALQLEVPSFVYLIDDIGRSQRFAEYVIKKIGVESQGRFQLNPENTVIASSTPEVFDKYLELGYQVLPVELIEQNPLRFVADPPWEVMNKWIQAVLAGADWRTQDDFVAHAAPATQRLYRKYALGDIILDLHRSPILTEDGDLTATRDYNTYVRSFDNGAKRKYDLSADLIQPGRIVDIGCCTGALLRELTLDPKFRESDFYGVEVARPLYAECLHRKEQGAFGTENVFFYQKDIASQKVFGDNSVNTFMTFSLTHEIESYSGRKALLHFMELLIEQLAMHGRWINVDVIGPRERDQQVLMKLERGDGRSDDYEKAFEPHDRQGLQAYLEGLSTYGRFLRFARDFRRAEGYAMPFEEVLWNGEPYIALTLQNACEFMSKKDYLDNWVSEMHETFCFWSFPEWCQAVEAAGFRIHRASRAFTNPWIVANRLEGKVELFQRASGPGKGIGGWERMPYPETNMVLLAEKV